MGVWERRVVPRLVEVTLANSEVDELRHEVCAGLHGRVLELGFGSGLNTHCYPPEVTEVAAVEPSDLGWEMSAERRGRSTAPIERVGLDGQVLPLPDGDVDAALTTFTLCTIPDVASALREARRVLRPGGALHFLEHGIAPSERVRAWQSRLEPLQRRVFGGCHLTRDVPRLLADAGFEVDLVRAEHLPGPGISRPWTFGYLGRAVASA